MEAGILLAPHHLVHKTSHLALVEALGNGFQCDPLGLLVGHVHAQRRLHLVRQTAVPPLTHTLQEQVQCARTDGWLLAVGDKLILVLQLDNIQADLALEGLPRDGLQAQEHHEVGCHRHSREDQRKQAHHRRQRKPIPEPDDDVPTDLYRVRLASLAGGDLSQVGPGARVVPAALAATASNKCCLHSITPGFHVVVDRDRVGAQADPKHEAKHDVEGHQIGLSVVSSGYTQCPDQCCRQPVGDGH
mmetsp:Transcript_5794/g.16280  ORF Transcript_5794/g.16280 Transcript_5794/m.16280 type:complete len:245 (+) Transcript_5794:495-1229(+)